ncbi:MAG: DUF1624 domain-containing protein [Burkholderiales bacterium]|nr:DUF1624 domain-containing protein [Burkholderiales bacterium]
MSTNLRYARLDRLRGLALVWMAIFHFCFDLSHFNLIQANFYVDSFWTTQRTCILSLFLICAGAGQAVATTQGQTWSRFWRRWAQVAGCALLVSVGSRLMFPESYIYFGVLHGMAVMLLLVRVGAHFRLLKGGGLWPVGLLLVLLPQWIQNPFFDSRATNWVGLITHKPITEDYVPILPWMGVMLWGLAATQWILARHPEWLTDRPSENPSPHGKVALLHPAALLSLLGRWSLTFYMVHQPILIGCLMAWMTLTGRPVP